MYNTFKALADETRCQILMEIISLSKIKRDVCACHLSNIECSQSTMSHHLKILTDAQLIKKVKNGKYYYYYLNNEEFDLIFEFINQRKELDVCN